MNKYLLTNANVDIISDEIAAFLDKCNVDIKDAMRIKLAVEETLLHYQEEFGEEQKVFINCRKRLGRSRIEIRIPATRFNPMELEEDEDEFDEEDEVDIKEIAENTYIANAMMRIDELAGTSANWSKTQLLKKLQMLK